MTTLKKTRKGQKSKNDEVDAEFLKLAGVGKMPEPEDEATKQLLNVMKSGLVGLSRNQTSLEAQVQVAISEMKGITKKMSGIEARLDKVEKSSEGSPLTGKKRLKNLAEATLATWKRMEKVDRTMPKYSFL